MPEVCHVFGPDCPDPDHKICQDLFLKYAKVVFCNDKGCLWNKDIPQRKHMRVSLTAEPLPGCAYTGVCTRRELALSPTEVNELRVKRRLATCAVRSDRGISGHLDFSRFPQGGNIPDPVEPVVPADLRS